MVLDTKMEFQQNCGYFIAKSKDEQMDLLVKKFEKIYGEKPTKLKIRFFDDNPFSVKNVRYNQSGIVCYCIDGKSIGKEKVKNLWHDKECLPSCEHLNSKDGQKPSCIQEGTLKFLLPEISLDRVWLMKIRGVTIINKISSYIETQKVLGNEIKGDFYMYLKREKQTRKSDGKSFNNYTIDILKLEDDGNENKAVVNILDTETEALPKDNEVIKKDIKKDEKKDSKPKKTEKKSKTEKIVDISQSNTEKTEAKQGDYDFSKCYAFFSIEPITITNKEGKKITYSLGNFCDMEDKSVSAIMKEELAEELKKCDLGTVLSLDIIERAGKKWITDFKFVQKCIKKVAA